MATRVRKHGGMSTDPDLSPLEVLEVVQLKALLNRAVHEANSLAAINRSIATILLDGANERAAHIAANALSLELRRDPTLNDVVSALGPELPGWQKRGWRDVQRLHRARNAAQHAGTSPDRDHLPLWTAATELFATSLIEASTGIALADVRLASAVRSPDLAEVLASAEERQQAGDPTGSLRGSSRAFAMALQHWRSQVLRTGGVPIGTGPLPRRDRAPRDQDIEVFALAGTFAIDPGEHVWFMNVTKGDIGVAPTLEESERALSFVFWWIVRWESFSEGYDPDRRGTQLRSLRRPRHREDAPARIEEIQSAHRNPDSCQVEFQLADVPATDSEFDRWREALEERLREEDVSAAGSFPHVVQIDDAGRLYMVINNDADATRLMQLILEGLRDVEVDVQKAAEDERRTDEQRAVAAEEYGRQAEQQSWPQWVRSVALRHDRRGTPYTSVRISGDPFWAADQVIMLLERDTELTMKDMTVGFELDEVIFTPERPTTQVARFMASVDLPFRELLEQRRQEEASGAAREAELLARLRACIPSE